MSEPTYRYTPYDLLLCKTDEDGNQELHPNGQPKLFSYSSDPVNDLFNEACYELNECEEKAEYNNWVQPIPMGQKPINKKQLTELLNIAYECVADAKRTLEVTERNLDKAIKEVHSDG